MVEVSCVHRAAQISWIQRLTESNNEKWKVVMLTIMGIKANQLNTK